MRILVANPIQILFPPMAKEFVAFKKKEPILPKCFTISMAFDLTSFGR